VAGFFKSPFRTNDESEVPDWIRAREDDIALQPHWLELEPAEVEPESSGPPPAREVTARRGDSISRLLGTSDPNAIGAFARANGLKRGDSTIYAGRNYVIPTDLGGTTADLRDGLLMIGRDNSRLARLQAEREQLQAARDARQQEAELAPRYGGRSSSRSAVAEPSKPDLAMRFSQAADGALARLPPRLLNTLDRSPWAKAIAGGIAGDLARGPGAVRGAVHTVEDIADLADFGYRITHPIYDVLQNGPEGSAWGETLNAGRGAVDLARRIQGDPGIVWRGIKDKTHQLNVGLNPGATPIPDTLRGEIQRRIPIGLNQGEAGFTVASTAYGGSEARALNGMNKVRKALAGPAFVEKYGPRTREYLAQPYVKGMDSHYIGRAKAKELGIPEWYVESVFNRSRPPGVTKAEMYLYHALFDPDFYGARLPNGLERPGWRFRDFGVDRFGPMERLIYGAPGPLKATVGGSVGAGTGALNYSAGQDD
jgi:hypothetical protein